MRRSKLLLIAILLLAACLRLYQLGEVPNHVHVDEVMNAYVGEFIWRNGVDLYNNSWPILYFNNFGDYPNVIPMYLSGLSTLLLGQNEFAIRLPIALFGILGVLVIYLLTKNITHHEGAALLSSLTMAIFPWHVILSRATAEGITAATVFSLGLYLLFRSLQRNKFSYLSLLAYGLLFATYLLYPSYRVILPLSLLPFFLLTPNKKQRLLAVTMTVLSFALTIAISQTTWGKGRFEQTSLFSTQSPVYALQSELISGEGHQQALKARLFYNKAIMFGREFAKQYSDYFSPSFWFSRGGQPMRYYLEDQGLWYYSYGLIFLLLVAISLSQNSRYTKAMQAILPSRTAKKQTIYLIYLLLLSPLAAALTIDEVPNIHRAALMIVPLSALSGIAIVMLRIIITSKMFYFILAALLTAESLFFYNKYLLHSNKFQQVYRSPGVKNLALFLSQQQNSYDLIFVSRKNEAAIYYLFFNQHFDKELSQRFESKLQLKEVANISFTQQECLSTEIIEQGLTKQNPLFIINAGCREQIASLGMQFPRLVQGSSIHQDNGDIAFYTYYPQP